MTKWEYIVRWTSGKDGVGQLYPQNGDYESLDILGSQGWELVNAVYDQASRTTVFYFKRPLQDPK